jgi:hypothetical protein
MDILEETTLKTRLMISILTTLALLPAAAASVGTCTAIGCAGTSTETVGSCSAPTGQTNFESQSGFAVVDSMGIHAATSAGTWCGAFRYPGVHGTANDVFAGAYVYDGHTGTAQRVNADWSAYSWSFGSGCDTTLGLIGEANHASSLGCPAGGPPNAPQVLP